MHLSYRALWFVDACDRVANMTGLFRLCNVNFHNPDNPCNPDNPSNRCKPHNPHNSHNPDNSHNLHNPHNPCNPDNPHNSHNPDNSPNPHNPHNLDNPQNPHNPNNPHELRSFCLMSCSPGVVSPGPRVVSPRVWSRFAQTESPHLWVCSWVPFLERGIFTHLFRLFLCVTLH